MSSMIEKYLKKFEQTVFLLINCSLVQFYAHECFFSWDFLYSWTTNKSSWHLRISLCAKSPECWHFCNENLLEFLGPLSCSGILVHHQSCVCGDHNIWALLFLCLEYQSLCTLLWASAVRISAVQSWIVFLQFLGTCMITVASWVMAVPLLWFKVQRIKTYSLLYMEPAGLLTSSAVLCGEDVLSHLVLGSRCILPAVLEGFILCFSYCHWVRRSVTWKKFGSSSVLVFQNNFCK